MKVRHLGQIALTMFVAQVVLTGCANHPPVDRQEERRLAEVDSTEAQRKQGMPQKTSGVVETARQHRVLNASELQAQLLDVATAKRAEDWERVEMLLSDVLYVSPDTSRYRLEYWKGLANWAMKDTTRRDSLMVLIRQDGNRFADGTSLNELYLSYMSAALVGDSVSQARSDRLCTMYPTSDEANEIIGGKFWDGLYPIWENDSAKVPYMHNFIQKYSKSDWALYARRNLIGCYFGLKDTVSAIAATNGLVYFGHDNPLVLNQAVGVMIDIPQAADSVQIWAERAYSNRNKLTRPSYYSPPEWALVEQVTKASFPLTLAALALRESTPPASGGGKAKAGAESRRTRLQLARKYAEESLSLAVYDIDDNNTPAPQYLMLGRIALAMKDSAKAAEYWVKAAIEGDVYNRSAGRAVDSLKAVFRLKDEKALLTFCRKTVKYSGMTFVRATSEAGLDEARGGRVAWGNFDNDQDDDLLAGGSRLFENNWTETRAWFAANEALRENRENIKLEFAKEIREKKITVPAEPDTSQPPKFFDITVVNDNDPHYDTAMRYSAPYLPSEIRGTCHGGVWDDYDSDGDLDLFGFSSSGDAEISERLYRNLVFENKALTIVKGHNFDDPNSEYWVGKAEKFRSESQLTKSPYGFGKGSTLPLLLDVTSDQPFLPDSFSTESAIWFDANGDRRPDLYIPGYERPAKGADDLGNAWPSRLLIQGANGEFRDSTEAYGIGKIKGRWLCGRSPVACDFDRDGDQDLYVGNYRLQENQLWVNNSPLQRQAAEADHTTATDRGGSTAVTLSDGGTKAEEFLRFTNLAAFYCVDGDEVEGWWGHTIGCEWGDFDGDGDFDLIACNLAHPRYIGFSNRTMLYRNEGAALPFTNVRRAWGIKYEECHSEPNWGDFDNDGDLDLFITCVYPNRRSFLYENKGDHFEDVTFLAGVRVFNGWGCATSDYNNDGRLDLAACEGGKIELFRNTTKNKNNWIEFRPDQNPALTLQTDVHIYFKDFRPLSRTGGIVEIEAGGKKIIRQFEGGKGAGSQNSGVLHFGLGKAKTCNMKLSNYGQSLQFDNLPANQIHQIDEHTEFSQPQDMMIID